MSEALQTRLTDTYNDRFSSEFRQNYTAMEPSLYCLALRSEFCRIIRSSSGVKRRSGRPVASLLGERHIQNISDKIQIKTRAAKRTADTTIAVVLSTAILLLLFFFFQTPAKCMHQNTNEKATSLCILYEFAISLNFSVVQTNDA